MTDLTRDLQAARDDRLDAAHYVSEFDQSRTHWREFQDRLNEVDRIARGKFRVYGPDGKLIAEEAPKTPNIVDLVLRDRSALAASVTPSLTCPTPPGADRSHAQFRERIAKGYLRFSRVNKLSRATWFRDLYKAGVNYKLVEPDFAANRPRIVRLDPRHTLPDRAYTPGETPSSVIVTSKKPLGVLLADYPEANDALHERAKLAQRPGTFGGTGLGQKDLIEIIEYYDASELIRVAVVPGPKGNAGVELIRVSNLINRVPVVVACEPIDDGIFQGVFDQMIGSLEADNTIVNLLIDSAVDWTTSPIISWNIQNPEDHGKGILYAKDGTAFHRRTPPDQASSQIFAVIAGLRGNAREGAVFPQARSGDIPQSAGSAAFVNSILGNYSTAVAQDQAIEAASFEEVLSLCFATDEVYLNASKPVDPMLPKGEKYTPSVAIKGNHAIDVNYGFSAGTDEFNAEIRLYSAVQNGIVAKKLARAKSVFVEDEVQNEHALIQEQLLDAGMAFIQQQASIGNFYPAAELNDALAAGEDLYLILSRIADFQQATPQPNAGASPTQAFEDAASAARGGSIDTTNVPGVGALPPMAQLLGA